MAELGLFGVANAAPDGAIQSPAANVTIATGQTVNFTASGSDPDGNTPLTYAWDFGNGIKSTMQNPTATFTTAGVYTVSLTVVDAFGTADPTPATRTVTVQAPTPTWIPTSGWTLQYADSQETVGENGAATNAFDGNANTFWHTQWYKTTTAKAYPHEIQINLGRSYTLSSFRYTPRQDGGVNGRLGKYEFYVSADGINWGTPVATGTFADSSNMQQVTFAAKAGQFIRLRALSEVRGTTAYPYASVAEIGVYGTSN
jgi:PKD repeat protein